MIRSARLFFVVPALLTAAFSFVGHALPAEKNESSIARMKKDIFFLASEECEGRGVETQGINKAADYIAATFRELGLKPAMPDGSYFQPFAIRKSTTLGPDNSVALAGPLGQAIKPVIGKHFSVLGYTAPGAASASLVFAGFGITVPSGYDDYKGIDVKGKIVIVLRQTPRAKNELVPFPREDLGALIAKIRNAEERKAAGIVFISDRMMAGDQDPLLAFGDHARAGETAKIPVFQFRRSLVDGMLAASGKTLAEIESGIDRDLQPRSFSLDGWSASLKATIEIGEIKAKNVIGVLEGKGPLANETVIVGAHYDHLGKGERGSLAGGSKATHYGADDNGSGTTAVLELARRFAALKNREGRRLVFMTFSGEERGLLGSRYYCKEPLYPLGDTAVMINLDMVGRLRPNKSDQKENLEIGGMGSSKSFEGIVNELNKKYDFHFTNSPPSLFGSSDHFSFYGKQVPVFFFFTGIHPEYHRPTDKPELINLEGMKKIVDMVEELSVTMATVKEKPAFTAIKFPMTKSASTDIPRIGIMPDYSESETRGVLVSAVTQGGPADKGGLKDGDWIVEIGGKPVKNMTNYMDAMKSQKRGEPVEIIVNRGDKKIPLKVIPQ